MKRLGLGDLGAGRRKDPPPNHLVPVFSCEKALHIKKIKIKIEGLGLGCLIVTCFTITSLIDL
jgi:hypothetical protein